MNDDTEISAAEQVFARMCTDEGFAERVSRGEFGDIALSADEQTALRHDAGLLISETSGFTSGFMVESMGISTSWVKPCPSHFWGSDFNAVRPSDARRPRG